MSRLVLLAKYFWCIFFGVLNFLYYSYMTLTRHFFRYSQNFAWHSHFNRVLPRMFSTSIPYDKLFEYVVARQGIVALCFVDGSTPCYDVSHDFNRLRLMNKLTDTDNLDKFIGWKVFDCSGEAESFFRSFYCLPGGLGVDVKVIPLPKFGADNEMNFCQPVNQEVPRHHEVLTESLESAFEAVQHPRLSSEERRLNKSLKLGEFAAMQDRLAHSTF